MGKKWLMVSCGFLALSAAALSWGATYWQLQTKLQTAGGSIQVRDAASQTKAGSIVYSNFSTSAPVPVAVSATLGYKISSLTRNGVAIPIGNYTSHYNTTFQKSGGSPQALVAGFVANRFLVTATASGPGTVTPSSASVSYGGSVVITGSPSTNGCYLTGVSGGTVTDAYGSPIALPYHGTVKITVSNVTAPRSVTASYFYYSTDAGVRQFAEKNSVVQLKGVMTGNGTPSWSQISGPAVILSGADTLTPSFIPTAAGTYQFKLTQTVSGVTVSSALTDVVVVESLVRDMRSRCMGCHGATGIYPAPYVFTGWSSSGHQVAGVSCIGCHTDGAMPTPINSSTVNSDSFSYTSGAGSFCLNGSCHLAGTTHKTPGMSCSGCHGNYRNHNPGTTFSAALNVCFNCHGAPNGVHYHVQQSLASSDCLTCHRATGHDPAPDATVTPAHFNGYTSYRNPAYAAAYVTPATVCADCHQGGDPKGAQDPALLQFRNDWAGSGHGSVQGRAWKNSDYFNWKTLGTHGADAKASASVATDCQRCHSAAGYLKFALYTTLEPVSNTAAGYSEPLTCNACHQSGDFAAPRAVSARTGFYSYSGAQTGRLQVSAQYPDAGRSNLCLGCHVGRQAGTTVQALAQATAQKNYSSAFWRDLRFVDAHYLSAGGQVYGVTGYHYPGVSYSNNGVNHTGIGSEGAGPCVACHLPGSSHTLDTAAAGFTLCNGCHIESGEVSAGFLSQRRAAFQAGMKALAAALAAKGFAPVTDANGDPQYPYFGNTNWGGKSDGPGNLGAAFNYNLLNHDPGAFAHNPAYVKRLVRDSIDYLTHGDVDRYRDLSPTVEALLASSSDRENAASFLSFAASGVSACQVCHQAAADPLTGGNIFADYRASKHASAPGGATCASCHAAADTVAHPPQPMLKETADINSNCLKCHDLHSWPSEGTCNVCHNGHKLDKIPPPPHLMNYTTAQYVTTNIQCEQCHYYGVDSKGRKRMEILQENRDWARSAKGDHLSPALTTFDFKTMGTPAPASPANTVQNDCVRCHTTTCYRNYVGSEFTDISAWGTSGLAPGGDRSREMIACSACHNPTPFDAGFSRVSVGIVDEFTGTRDVRSWYNYSSAATGKIIRSKLFLDGSAYDIGDSNICITCHAGRSAGDLIKQTLTNTQTGAVTCSTVPSIVCRLGNNNAAAGLVNDFWGDVDFIDPHGGIAANMIYPDNLRPGYEFRPAALFTSHANVGMGTGTGQGPCVGCHMTSGAKHSFTALSTATNGVISGFRSSACSECHGIIAMEFTAADLQTKKSAYNAALSLVASQLANQGIHYNRDRHPYFFDTPEPSQQSHDTRTTNWNKSAAFRGAHLMGAAFNLRLLDSGSGWVHNGTYSKRLLYDTIDYLDDGLNNNTVSQTVQSQQILGYIYPRR